MAGREESGLVLLADSHCHTHLTMDELSSKVKGRTQKAAHAQISFPSLCIYRDIDVGMCYITQFLVFVSLCSINTGNGKTAILMSDSRSLQEGSYLSLSYRINKHYAYLHQYEMIFLQYPCLSKAIRTTSGIAQSSHPATLNRKHCVCAIHETYGARAAPWCKILAINSTLHSNPDIEWLLYIDSDAFVQNMAQPLDSAFLSTTSDVTLTFNFPWTWKPANSGIMFIHNTPASRGIFEEWWNVKSSKNMIHDFEQSVLPTMLSKYPSSFSVLKLRTFVVGRHRVPKNQTFVHVGSGQKHRRIAIMRSHIQEHNIP